MTPNSGDGEGGGVEHRMEKGFEIPFRRSSLIIMVGRVSIRGSDSQSQPLVGGSCTNEAIQ